MLCNKYRGVVKMHLLLSLRTSFELWALFSWLQLIDSVCLWHTSWLKLVVKDSGLLWTLSELLTQEMLSLKLSTPNCFPGLSSGSTPSSINRRKWHLLLFWISLVLRYCVDCLVVLFVDCQFLCRTLKRTASNRCASTMPMRTSSITSISTYSNLNRYNTLLGKWSALLLTTKETLKMKWLIKMLKILIFQRANFQDEKFWKVIQALQCHIVHVLKSLRDGCLQAILYVKIHSQRREVQVSSRHHIPLW